jgi:hypothetical protein
VSTHPCPAPNCDREVPFEQLACRAHWFLIPKPLRDELWRAYREDGIGSETHGAAVDACIDFLRKAVA